MTAAECFYYFIEIVYRHVYLPGFDFGDVLLVDAHFTGKLMLREAFLNALMPDVFSYYFFSCVHNFFCGANKKHLFEKEVTMLSGLMYSTKANC